MCREHYRELAPCELDKQRNQLLPTRHNFQNTNHCNKTLLLTPTSLPKVLALFDELDAKDLPSSDRFFWLERGSPNRSALAGFSTNFLSSMFNLCSLSAVDQKSACKILINNDKNANYRNNNSNKKVSLSLSYRLIPKKNAYHLKQSPRPPVVCCRF